MSDVIENGADNSALVQAMWTGVLVGLIVLTALLLGILVGAIGYYHYGAPQIQKVETVKEVKVPTDPVVVQFARSKCVFGMRDGKPWSVCSGKYPWFNLPGLAETPVDEHRRTTVE